MACVREEGDDCLQEVRGRHGRVRGPRAFRRRRSWAQDSDVLNHARGAILYYSVPVSNLCLVDMHFQHPWTHTKTSVVIIGLHGVAFLFLIALWSTGRSAALFAAPFPLITLLGELRLIQPRTSVSRIEIAAHQTAILSSAAILVTVAILLWAWASSTSTKVADGGVFLVLIAPFSVILTALAAGGFAIALTRRRRAHP